MAIGRRVLVQGLAAAALLGGCAAMPAEAPADRAALQAHLMGLEIASWQYFKDKDVAAMGAYHGDGAMLVFADGSRFTEAEYLAIMPSFDVESFAVDRGSAHTILVSPDVAILMYRASYTAGMKGQRPTTTSVISSSTYVRRGGKWLSVLYQETPVK
ncbi:MAG: nuclear transport factor 2 family protein [Alphaproteobacteria bacterium]